MSAYWLHPANFVMLKTQIKRMVVPGLILGTTILLIMSGLKPAFASVKKATDIRGLSLMPTVLAPSTPAPAGPASSTFATGSNASDPGSPAVLDGHRRMALGMIETGNRDSEIGGAGEVSRYQIMPTVWRQYSQSMNYRNPDVSLAVAQKYWTQLYTRFVRQAHRQPNDFDMYVLWNTHYGYYANRGFDPSRLSAVVRDRAQRYVNLVQCDDY